MLVYFAILIVSRKNFIQVIASCKQFIFLFLLPEVLRIKLKALYMLDHSNIKLHCQPL